MKRRKFVTLLGGAITMFSLSASAEQPGKVPRIGLMARTPAGTLTPLLNSFRKGLRDLGWNDGKNVTIDYQFGDGRFERLGELAATLVGRQVDVIVTVDTPTTQAAKQATSSIPIIIAVSADPVGAGLVASLAHPGGNITGLSLLAPDTDQKNLEIVKEALPKIRRVGMIWDPNNRGMTIRVQAIRAAASKLDVEFQATAALDSNELVDGLRTIAQDPPDALIVLSPIYAAYQGQITEFAAKTKVPLIFDTRSLAAEPGALLSYGADISALFLRSASYVDKILKGARAADLPVEQPTKFELLVNLRTAKSLGLTIPPTLLTRADEVIE
jgi:putative ABC transport system substrate-binding protein